MLLNAGADAARADWTGRTAADYASEMRHGSSPSAFRQRQRRWSAPDAEPVAPARDDDDDDAPATARW